MMSAQRDWHRRALACSAIGDRSPLLGRSTASAPLFLVLDIATDTDLACHPSRGTMFWLRMGHRFA